jgi:hypothetical protein
MIYKLDKKTNNDLQIRQILKRWHTCKYSNDFFQDSAHMYVCGDAQRMAHDVHKMLLYIAQMEGNMNVNNADNFLKSLEDESRYQKDVWIS